ncbi:hypothetical protein HDU67_009399 [Dinochytrium kinnereticum]|nr:hypothetical protein HDU67_009399 [Dinochytrium kinnereticum]
MLSEAYSVDVTCIPCYGRSSSSSAEIEPENVRARGRKRRVNVFGRDRPVRCEACGQGVGFGGIRLTVVKNDSSSDVKEREWVEPRFAVEVVCDKCVIDFDFCTQCGGGGSHRTGKWRPRQLFKANRRTCTLSHTRIGDMDKYHAVSYRCPWERLREFQPGNDSVSISSFDPEPIIERSDPAVEAFLRGPAHLPPLQGSSLLRQAAGHVADLHSHAYHTFFALPAVMRMVEFLGSWDLLNTRCRRIQDELDMLIMGGHKAIPPGRIVGEVRRFAALAHILRTGKTSAAMKKKEQTDNATIMAVGVTTCQWHVNERHVLLALGVVLGNGSLDKSGSMTHTLHTSMIRRIHNDVKDGQIPAPLHVWTLYRRRLSGISAGAEPELMRAGFSPIDEYCSRWGLDQKELEGKLQSFVFDNNFVQWNYTIFVAKWEDLKWTWGIRESS